LFVELWVFKGFDEDLFITIIYLNMNDLIFMDLTDKTDEITARAIEAKKLHDYFISKLPELVKEHIWEYALFGEEKSFEFYKSFKVASEEGVKKYGLEKVFLIQRVEPFPPTNIVFNAIPSK